MVSGPHPTHNRSRITLHYTTVSVLRSYIIKFPVQGIQTQIRILWLYPHRRGHGPIRHDCCRFQPAGSDVRREPMSRSLCLETPFPLPTVSYFPPSLFVLHACTTNPKLRHEFLERTFPAQDVVPPTKEATSGKPSGCNVHPAGGEPRLNVKNTLIKMVLDQTAGAAVNTFLFALYMYGITAAMAHRPAQPGESLAFLLSGSAVDYQKVNWRTVLSQSWDAFWELMVAVWTFWPFVSLFNFIFVKGFEARNLVSCLAGFVWGIYLSKSVCS